MPTPLIPQEIFLLERYSSLEYYGLARDAWEDVVKYVADCLTRFMNDLPLDYRSRPLREQPDIVWGERVLPNFQDTLAYLYDGYIKRSHCDWSCYQGFQGGINGDIRGQREFSDAWFDEVEPGGSDKYSELLHRAGRYADPIWRTAGAYWLSGALGARYNPDSRGPFPNVEAWPRYRLNSEVVVMSGEPVPRTGIYLPEIDDSCAQFLIAGEPADEANVGYDPVRMQNVGRAPAHWVLVERVAGETVPLEAGLGPIEIAPTRVPAGKPAPRSGYWLTPAKPNSRRHFKQGDVFPEVADSSYGATFWQWSPDQSDPKL